MFCGNSKMYKGKSNNGYFKAPPPFLNVKYVFELRRTCPNYFLYMYVHVYLYISIYLSVLNVIFVIAPGEPKNAFCWKATEFYLFSIFASNSYLTLHLSIFIFICLTFYLSIYLSVRHSIINFVRLFSEPV